MTLGADLASITDVRTRKLLMMKIQALTIGKMFSESRAAPINSEPVNHSSRPASAPLLHGMTMPTGTKTLVIQISF